MNFFRSEVTVQDLNNLYKQTQAKIKLYKDMYKLVKAEKSKLDNYEEQYYKNAQDFYDSLLEAQTLSDQVFQDMVVTDDERNALIQKYEIAEQRQELTESMKDVYFDAWESMEELVKRMDNLDDEIIKLSNKLNAKMRKYKQKV